MEKKKRSASPAASRNRSRDLSIGFVILAFIVLEILMRTGHLSSLFTNLLVPICCYVVTALGLNLNVGVSGELNLGQAGFMSIGAFTGVVISGALATAVPSPVIRLILAILAGTLTASLAGFLIGIPVLKLQGDYLAIVTLAFGQIIMSLLNNVYLGFDTAGFHFSFVQQSFKLAPGGKMLIGGPMGATGTAKIATFPAAVIIVLIALIIIYNITDSRFGRAIMSTRDNRIASESVGIDVARTKMLAFVISAALAGAAGAVYGLDYTTLTPAKFSFNQSIMILVYVVLGGLGNMFGTLISTVALILLPELLRGLQDYRMIIYAVVLIVVMLVSNNETLRTKISGLRQRHPASEGAEHHE